VTLTNTPTSTATATATVTSTNTPTSTATAEPLAAFIAPEDDNGIVLGWWALAATLVILGGTMLRWRPSRMADEIEGVGDAIRDAAKNEK
jgi:uncharacterized protein HemX